MVGPAQASDLAASGSTLSAPTKRDDAVEETHRSSIAGGSAALPG
jgi:hypothetical protein